MIPKIPKSHVRGENRKMLLFDINPVFFKSGSFFKFGASSASSGGASFAEVTTVFPRRCCARLAAALWFLAATDLPALRPRPAILNAPGFVLIYNGTQSIL